MNATSPAGATVVYSASASDLVDPSPTLSCVPPSGSVFPIGTTTVNCTATDDRGNSAAGSFTVRVKGPGEQIAALMDKTTALVNSAVLRIGLRATLQAAAGALLLPALVGKPVACAALTVYINAVNSPRAPITPQNQASLTADANRILAVIGC